MTRKDLASLQVEVTAEAFKSEMTNHWEYRRTDAVTSINRQSDGCHATDATYLVGSRYLCAAELYAYESKHPDSSGAHRGECRCG